MEILSCVPLEFFAHALLRVISPSLFLSMGQSAGFLIYSGVMPLLKTFLTIYFGWILARKDMFPASASRGASFVSMNVALPGLIFANIVPAFNPDNVSAMGPLFLLAFTYVGLGLLFGLIIREVCYVPRNFWQGVVVATALSNWGNLPTAVVLTVTEHEPFNPDIDPRLGVSYVTIFILTMNICFWVCGGAQSIAWDYLPHVPQGDEAKQHVSWRAKPIGGLIARHLLGDRNIRNTDTIHVKHSEKGKEKEEITPAEFASPKAEEEDAGRDVELQITHQPSNPSIHIPSVHSRISAGPSSQPPALPSPESLRRIQSAPRPLIPNLLVRILRPLSALFTPVTITIYISLIVALVPPLKALFTDATASGGPILKGPDGRPPLYFIIDTAEFVGGLTVPLALILLGASFARMKIGGAFAQLPLTAIFAVTSVKLILLPVVGVLLVQGMVGNGLIPRGANAEKFVGMFLSGTPTAVNQLIVTQLYAKDSKDMDTLVAFLLAQYIFMFISSSALTAVALALL